MRDELVIFVPGEVRDVFEIAREKIIDRDGGMTLRQELKWVER